ncbi:MAG TPA: hypothetical protein VH914_16620 [Acidimicrobiia bacterium]|jgi:hypothetical protein|nr:hypothetical protein [Acidimicrobiia bacterium]
MTSRRALWVGGALGLVCVVLRVVPFVGAHIGKGLDSYDYLASSHAGFFTRDLWAGDRAPGYPLYLKLVDRNLHVAVVGQLVLVTAAWLVLALMAARATRDLRLQIAAVVVVLGFGVTLDAVQWDRVISTEALSSAFAVGFLAAVLWLRERWTGPRVAVAVVLALLMTALRDSNGTFLGLVGVALLICVAVRALRPRVLVLAGLLVVIAVAGTVSAGIGKRWQEPVQNVFTMRLFNSPERLQSLYHSGLPLTLGQVIAVQGRCVAATPIPPCAKLRSPAFYDWIQDHGREAYIHEMWKTPATTVWEPLSHIRESVGTRNRVDIASGTYEHAPVSEALEKVFDVRNPAVAVGWAIALLVLMLVAAVRRRRGVWVIATAMLVATYPHLWLVWVGDAEEVTRHSLLASMQLHLALLLGTVWLIDAFVAREHAPTS